MMSLIELYVLAGAMILGYVLLIYLASLRLKNASIMDIFWGLGFVLLAGIGLALGRGYPGRRMLVAVLVGVWGLRLSLHILRRNRGRPEDYRYRAWRKRAGERFWLVSLFQVFLLQGLLLTLVAAPVLFAQSSPEPRQFTLFDAAGALVWGVGFLFETVGDWQLERFKRTRASRGELLRSGLWAWTRHPNYFGDATVWWGLYLIALGVPGGWLAVYGPIVMTLLLWRVTGAAVLEKGLARSKPGYAEYVETTSGFIPWFPRKRTTDSGSAVQKKSEGEL